MTVKLLMSACLIGQCCRYDAQNGKSIVTPKLHKMLNNGEVAVICPELAGGLGVPRDHCEIASGGTAAGVLDGAAKVLTIKSEDKTESFIKGARATLELVQKYSIKTAVMKEGSPSCGVHSVHIGAFDGNLVEGRGVTAELLARNGVRVFSEDELESAIQYAEQQAL